MSSLNELAIGTISYNNDTLYWHADGMTDSIISHNSKMIKLMTPFYPYLIKNKNGDRIIQFKEVIPREVKIKIQFRDETLTDIIRFRIQGLRLSFANFVYPHDVAIEGCDYPIQQRIVMKIMILLSKIHMFWEWLEYQYE